MPMVRGSPRWSPDVKNGGGRLLVDLLDAHTHEKPKIELCHHHGGGRLLVDLKEARDNGNHKMELCHHHGSHRRTHLTWFSIFSHVCYLSIFKSTCISPFVS